MKKPYKRSKYKIMGRQVAFESVRNSMLEDLHAGKQLPEKYRKGNYSRITSQEMRSLMLEIEKNISKSMWVWFKNRNNTWLLKQMEEQLFDIGVSWDRPKDVFNKYREK